MPSSRKLINKGRISYETSLLYKVYSILDPQKLPAEYQSSAPGKCATPISREVVRNWGTLNPQVKTALTAYPAFLSRPSLSGPELTYDTAHFQIHYTTSGKDAADPGYIEAIGAELENVWTAELDAMGWLRPPSDQTVRHPGLGCGRWRRSSSSTGVLGTGRGLLQRGIRWLPERSR